MTTSTVIRNAAILQGRDLRLVERTDLSLEGGRVAAIGRSAAPAGAEVVDGAGSLLVPGFVDAHVHIGFADPGEVLRRGVTTVRDLGWPPPDVFPLARASTASSFHGPLILAAGPILTA
ncbi:MAG TPA: amidohydrolase, partial [Actinomycetota bacterium]|nr:amidohydrolase [Actinomycetota bacterium]